MLGFRTYTFQDLQALCLLGTSAVTHQGGYEVCRALTATEQGAFEGENYNPLDDLWRKNLGHMLKDYWHDDTYSTVTHARHELMQDEGRQWQARRRRIHEDQPDPMWL